MMSEELLMKDQIQIISQLIQENYQSKTKGSYHILSIMIDYYDD